MTEAIFGLLGVLAGGAVTAVATVWVHNHQLRKEASVLARSIRAEILALMKAVQLQRFEEHLAELRDRSLSSSDIYWFCSLEARENYFAVYSANVGRLGLLTAHQAEAVVEFYTLAKAWLEDMRSGKDDATRDQAIKRLEENLQALKQIKHVGEVACALLSGELELPEAEAVAEEAQA